MNKKLLVTKRIQVPIYKFQEIRLPELVAYKTEELQAETDDGVIQPLKAAHRPPNYVVTFNKPIDSLINLSFYLLLDKEEKVKEIPEKTKKEEPPKPDLKIVEVVETIPVPVKKRIPFYKVLQLRQAGRQEKSELNQAGIAKIRDKDISIKNLEGKAILTFDSTGCLPRGLGMIQKAAQLQHQLNTPLYRFYDRISGQGEGAIIAASIAAGIDFNTLLKWWMSEWKKVHSPHIGKKIARWGVRLISTHQSGYNAKEARKALRKLFTKAKTDLLLKNTLTELQITVIQADLNISTHYSFEASDLELYIGVEDSAITKVGYNQGATIKGEAIFLGAVEKNDVLGFLLADNNKNMILHSIGAPARINPVRAKKLSKKGHAAMTSMLRRSNHFVYNKRVEGVIAKLTENGFKIDYLRLECNAIDSVVANDTSDQAMRAGIASGDGTINHLPQGGKNEKIA